MKSTKFQVFVQCKDREANVIFRKIAHIELEDGQVGFCLKSLDSKEPTETCLKTDQVYPYAKRSIEGMNILKILIQDTKNRRAPVLKKIEVWGLLSKRNALEDIEMLKKLLRSSETNTLRTTENQPSLDTTGLNFQIPEDFMDSITNDLMVMPYVLPSGNIIDETSIEKHNRHEAAYGRLPSDPFTGLVYTPNHHPKFNDSLKQRLDDFKLRNSQELEVKKSGRTVGKKREPVASTSGYASSEHISKKIKLNGSSSTDLDSLISSMYKNKQVSVFTKPKAVESTEKQPSCFKCRENSKLGLYRISRCGHSFCKPCLLASVSSCAACQSSFESKDVIKLSL